MSLEGVSLRTIYEVLKYQIEFGKQASQADVPTSSLVQIMTIHKSKGLQFPAVVLPEMNKPDIADKSSIMHGKTPVKNNKDFYRLINIEVGITLHDEEGETQKTNMLNNIKMIANR